MNTEMLPLVKKALLEIIHFAEVQILRLDDEHVGRWEELKMVAVEMQHEVAAAVPNMERIQHLVIQLNTVSHLIAVPSESFLLPPPEARHVVFLVQRVVSYLPALRGSL